MLRQPMLGSTPKQTSPMQARSKTQRPLVEPAGVRAEAARAAVDLALEARAV